MIDFPFGLAAPDWVPWFYLYKALLSFNHSAIYPQWVSYLPGAAIMGWFALF